MGIRRGDVLRMGVSVLQTFVGTLRNLCLLNERECMCLLCGVYIDYKYMA